jgi:hypothetical protein
MQPSCLLTTAIALSSTALVFAFPLLPAVAAPAQTTPVLPSEPAPPRIDATTQRWLDRLWQTADRISNPKDKAETWVRIANLYRDPYQNAPKSSEAMTKAIAAAQTIPDAADRADALLQILPSQTADPSAAKTLVLVLEAIAAVADPQRKDGLLEFAILAAVVLDRSVPLQPEVQPLTLVDRLQDPQSREIRRSYVVESIVSHLVSQNQLEAAIDLIQQTPVSPFYGDPVDPAQLTNPSRDLLLQGKMEQLSSLVGGLFQQVSGDTLVPVEPQNLDAIATQLRPIAQAWMAPIQDPYIKAKTQAHWIFQLIQLQQPDEAIAQAQEFLRHLPNQPLSPQQKVELLLPLTQLTWESEPKLQPIVQQLTQALKAQFSAMDNTAQPQKAQLLLDAVYGASYSSSSLLDVLTQEAHTITDAKLRSGLLYALSVQYELTNNDTEANALYNEILPILDQMEDPIHAIEVLMQLGQTEDAIEYAKTRNEDDVFSHLSAQFLNQQSIPAALDLARRIQEPWSRTLALAQISATLSSTNAPDPQAPLQEAIAYIQTFPEAEQYNVIYSFGQYLSTPDSLKLIDSLSPRVQAGALLGQVEVYGWAESEQNNRIAQRLAQLVPSLTDSEPKNRVLSTLAYLDAADQPDRVSQWVDLLQPADQADALLRAIHLRSHLSTFPYP